MTVDIKEAYLVRGGWVTVDIKEAYLARRGWVTVWLKRPIKKSLIRRG